MHTPTNEQTNGAVLDVIKDVGLFFWAILKPYIRSYIFQNWFDPSAPFYHYSSSHYFCALDYIDKWTDIEFLLFFSNKNVCENNFPQVTENYLGNFVASKSSGKSKSECIAGAL